MATIKPHSENVRQAIRFISEKAEETGEAFEVLINKHAMRFNLSPKECEFLVGFFKQNCKSEE